jgi:type I restriction enzyme R subunit
LPNRLLPDRLGDLQCRARSRPDRWFTHDEQLVYVNNVIKGKLLVDELLSQATNNTKEQFTASPTLSTELMNAIMDALVANQTMSKQALTSEKVARA